jgi:hypothetical protein
MDRELVLAVRGKAAYALVPAKDKITVNLGDKISIAATMKPLASDFKGDVTVSVVGPQVLTLAPVKLSADKETTLTLDLKNNALDKIGPGVYTIVLRGQSQPVNPKDNPNKKTAGPPNLIEHSIPIEVTIVGKGGKQRADLAPKPAGGARPANAAVAAKPTGPATPRVPKVADAAADRQPRVPK